MTTRNVLERANLPLEGYFRALYLPLGGSRTRMENAPFKSMKFCISMLRDKPLCMPLCFGTAVIILSEAIGAFSSFLAFAEVTISLLASALAGFFSFLASAATAFFSVFSSWLAFFLLFFFFHFLLFFFDFSSFLGSVFNPDRLCNCLRLSFQPGWVM